MNFIEEEFKKRFKNAASTKGIDPEQLWENIANGLPKTPPKSGFKKRFLLFLGLSLLILFAGTWLFLGTPKSDNTSVTSISEHNTSNSVSKTENSTQNKPLLQNNATNITPSSSENTQSSDLKNSSKARTNTSVFSQKTSFQNALKPGATKKTPADLGFATSEKTNTPQFLMPKNEAAASPIFSKNTPTDTFFDNKTLDITSVVSENQDSKIPATSEGERAENVVLAGEKSLNSIAVLDILPVDILPIKEPRQQRVISEKEPEALPLLALDIVPKIHRSKVWEINFLSGANLNRLRFQAKSNGSGFEKTLDKTLSSRIGYQFSIEIHRKISENFQIGSGLVFSQINTRFDFVETRDTMVLDQIKMKLRPALATRTVEHYNKLQVLTLPLTFGASKHFGKVKAGLHLGIGLNYSILEKGKSLNSNGQVVTFDSRTDQNRPSSSFFLSAIANPYLDFAFSKQNSLRLQASIRAQSFGTSPLFDLKTSSVFGGLNVGLSHRF